jgi:hypothetical protein
MVEIVEDDKGPTLTVPSASDLVHAYFRTHAATRSARERESFPKRLLYRDRS